jgi:hypothetical protein
VAKSPSTFTSLIPVTPLWQHYDLLATIAFHIWKNLGLPEIQRAISYKIKMLTTASLESDLIPFGGPSFK